MDLLNKPTFPRILLVISSISCLVVAQGDVSASNGTTTTTITPPNAGTGSQEPASESPQLLSTSTSSASFTNSTSSSASSYVSSTTEDSSLLASAAAAREETPQTGTVAEERGGSPSAAAGAVPTAGPTRRGATSAAAAAATTTTTTAASVDAAFLTASPSPGRGDAEAAWSTTRATAGISNSTGGGPEFPTTGNGTADSGGGVATARAPSSTAASQPAPGQAGTVAAAASAAPVDFPPVSVPTAAATSGFSAAAGEGSPSGPRGTAGTVAAAWSGAAPSGGPESAEAAGTALPELPESLAVTRPMRTSTAVDHQAGPTEPRPGHAGTAAAESSPDCNGTTHAGGEAGTATPTEPPVLVCHPNPCPVGELCFPETDGEGNFSTPYTCRCPTGWQGTNCTYDVDECSGNRTNPCPPFSVCKNRPGGFVCECPLGFYQDYPRGCLAAKTFLGNVSLKNSVFTAEMGDPSSRAFMDLQDNITRMMNETFKDKSLSYQGTTVLSVTNGSVVVSVLHLFASTSTATNRTVNEAIRNYTGGCANTSACEFVRGSNFSYIEGDVCSLAVCDERSSRCVHLNGDVSCACRDGFFKHSPMDHVCRACENGYKLHNNACVKCSFGYYGHQCEEGYLLVAVILAAMGGGLLVNFAVALSITCYRKRRLEAQRARYKDEGFQLSPYAELPRIPRAQSAWGGRETYEMQENGSTRNLLHPEESYIAPAYRSSVKMGEPGQPYSVLPPGQYMYGGQHNPSYVHDDTRRRDYF